MVEDESRLELSLRWEVEEELGIGLIKDMGFFWWLIHQMSDFFLIHRVFKTDIVKEGKNKIERAWSSIFYLKRWWSLFREILHRFFDGRYDHRRCLIQRQFFSGATKHLYSMFQLVWNIIRRHNSRKNRDNLIVKEVSERLLFGILY